MHTDSTLNSITQGEFLSVIYRNVGDAGVPLAARTVENRDGDIVFPVKRYHPRARGYTHGCVGVCHSAMRRPNRQAASIAAVAVLALDDIGTKAEEPPLTPTAVVETSPGNYTYIYRLSTPCEPEQAEAIMHSMIEAGFCDPAAGDRARLFRIPHSKPINKEHTAALTAWNPDVEYDADTFLEQGNVTLTERERNAAGGERVPAPPGSPPVVDEVLDWLHETGRYVGEDSDGWVKIRCPWADTHTNQRDDIAKYRPATNESIVRVFYCHHTHGHTTPQFLDWVRENDGPDAPMEVQFERNLNDLVGSGVAIDEEAVEEADNRIARNAANLQRALDTLVLYQPSNKIIELNGSGHYPLNVIAGVKAAWAPWPQIGENGRHTSTVALWHASPDKKVTATPPHLDPRETPGWAGTFVNTYQPFQPGEPGDGSSWEMFKELVAFTYCGAPEYALNWMAHKVQHPEERMVALVNYTPIFGTGRSSIMKIMGKLVGNAAHVQASRIVGTAANQFNGFLDNLLVLVHEVAESGEDTRAMRLAYNKLKGIVDPNLTEVTIERKGLEPFAAETFASFLIATNAPNGLPLERGDRRFSVVKGNTNELRNKRMDIVRWLEAGPNLTDIHAGLMAHQIDKLFRPAEPLKSDAKLDMIDASRSPVDRIIEQTLAYDIGAKVFVSAMLQRYIIESGKLDEIGMDSQRFKQHFELWSRHRTRPVDHHGAKGRVKRMDMVMYARQEVTTMMSKEETDGHLQTFLDVVTNPKVTRLRP